MPTLRIATFNVHHCRGLDGSVNVERTAEVIASLDADLVALQELDRGLPRSGGLDQPGELARCLGLDVIFFPTIQRGEGSYGHGVAARPPMEEATYLPLPQTKSEEPRGVIAGRWRGLSVVCTHLSTSGAARRAQTEALSALAAAAADPVVVLGDLNQPPRSLGALTSKGFHGAFGYRTLPRARLRRQIDHILVRGAHLERSWTVDTTASDHLALVAEVRVEPA